MPVLLFINAYKTETPCSWSPGSIPHWVYGVIEHFFLIENRLLIIEFLIAIFLIIAGTFQKGFRKALLIIPLTTIIFFILLSLGSARGRCRDCMRIEDLRQMSIFLETYYKDNGKYPGVAGSNQWEDLRELYEKFDGELPTDPCDKYEGNKAWVYEYWVSSDGQQNVLKANFQKHNSWLDEDLDGVILGAYCGQNGLSEREFCQSSQFFKTQFSR